GAANGTATIIFVSPLLNKDTRTARVVASLDNPQRMWMPGTFVTAGIVVETQDAPVLAPFSAIQNIDGRKAVFVRTSDGFGKRDVRPGERDGQHVAILSGLRPGETIASTNTFALKAELAKPAGED